MKTPSCALVCVLMLGACATDNILAAPVPAVRETAPMTGAGDRADDPAIWVHPSNAALSLILGTNKDEGVHVYDLDGRELQKIAVGPSNNIDVRGNLAVASNDGVNALSWFRIDPATRQVSHAGDTRLTTVEPYGVCAGVVGGVYHAAVTYKTGAVEVYSVADPGAGAVSITLARTHKLATQLEGCVFDEENGRLFVGEEAHGVWALPLSGEGAPAEVDNVRSGSGLVADVEGVSLWKAADGSGFLVVSAQSRDRFTVYDRLPPFALRGVVTVTASADGSVDAVTHTDGLDVTSAALPGFPAGVLVVQDDANPRSEVDQNFKIADWRDVARALGITP